MRAIQVVIADEGICKPVVIARPAVFESGWSVSVCE